VSLGAGKYGVLQSLEPIAVTTDRHRHIPVDLSLKRDGSSFRPTVPVVQVSIPTRLNAGVSMPRLGVSLTPVSQDGAALRAAAGRADAATVIYTGAETDTDMVAKPTTLGFALDAILRSQESPQDLYFRIDAPHRARLSQPDHDGSGPVTITEGSSQIGVIVPVSATDAAGTAVPATMSRSAPRGLLSVPDRGRSGNQRRPTRHESVRQENPLGIQNHQHRRLRRHRDLRRGGQRTPRNQGYGGIPQE
jgi:hypothetical protein